MWSFDALGEAQSPPVEWYPREDPLFIQEPILTAGMSVKFKLRAMKATSTVNMPRLDEYGVSYDPIWQPYSVDTFLTTIDGNNILIGFVEENGVIQYITHRAFVAHRSAEAPPPLPHPPDLSKCTTQHCFHTSRTRSSALNSPASDCEPDRM